MSQTDPVYEVPQRFRHLFAKRSPRDQTVQQLPPPLSVNAGLEPLDTPLTPRQAGHLLRRTAFGGTAERRASLVGQTASSVVEKMVNGARLKPQPPAPVWNTHYPPWQGTEQEIRRYNDLQFEWYVELTSSWIARMLKGGLREKLMLFWHDHFVTERATYFYSIMSYRYLALISRYALGNFKDFVVLMGLEPAMLVYLDGRLSTRISPNENYARELVELFTMGQYDRHGQPNYTQEDIVEISRALTGYRVNYGTFTRYLSENRVDRTHKTVFGRQGNFDFGGVHNVVFEERATQIADFICRKLYTEFVYVTPHEGVVAEMADLFLQNDFEIAPVLEALLRSAHFYADEVIGAQIKSPAQLYIGLLRDMGEAMPTVRGLRRTRVNMGQLSQWLLNPPNVAGWPGYRTWVSTSTLPIRWQQMDYLLQGSIRDYYINPVQLARELVDPSDPLAAFKVPVAMAEHLLAVPPSEIAFDAPPNFAGDLQTFPIPQEIVEGPAFVRDLAKVFLGSFPWYDWHLNRQGISYGLIRYTQWLMRRPEFQLT